MAEKTPTATPKAFALDTPNAKIANLIRRHASPEYRARIPEATDATIAATANAIDNDVMLWNEFASAIMNKVGLTIAKVSTWNNRLSKFKRGDLAYGDTVEEIHTNLIKAKHYSSNDFHGERDLFGRIKPDTYTAYHKLNRQDYYGITVDRIALRKAFTTENGLALYIDQLMSAPVTSDQWDEYLLMREALGFVADKVKYVNIPEIPTTGDATVAARAGMATIVEYAELLTFPSRDYNMAGVDAWAVREDMELFVTPKYKAKLDIEALATLYHIDKADVPARITVVDKMPAALGNAQAILTTKDIFLVMDYLVDMTNQPNAVGLHTNFFFHHHELISISPFTPIIVFTTDAVDPDPAPEDEPTITGITANVTEAGFTTPVTEYAPRGAYKVHATAVSDPDTDGYGGYVVSFKSGNHPRSNVTPDGWVFIAEEQTGAVVFDVQSAVDPSIITTVTLNAPTPIDPEARAGDDGGGTPTE